jgi:hypothetical protein
MSPRGFIIFGEQQLTRSLGERVREATAQLLGEQVGGITGELARFGQERVEDILVDEGHKRDEGVGANH